MAELVDIKDISGNIRFSTPINEGSKRRFLLMQEDYITLLFSLSNPVYFKLGDYVDNELGIFELVDLYKPREKAGPDAEEEQARHSEKKQARTPRNCENPSRDSLKTATCL